MTERWTRKRIRETQAEVRKELGEIPHGSSKRGRIDYILKRIQDLEDDASSIGKLRRYVYVVSALLQQSMTLVLTPWQEERLQELAFAILRTQGIRETHSKLSFLYGDIHQGLSIISRTRGEQWNAAWEQQIASDLSHNRAPAGKGYHNLSRGIRAFRLAHGTIALNNFIAAEKLGLGAKTRVRARIEQTKLLRLAGDRVGALELAQETLNLEEITVEERLELQWDSLCCKPQPQERITELSRLVRRGGTHHQPDYILEAFFWTRVTADTSALKKVPSFKSLAWDPSLQFKTKDLFYQFAVLLENIYRDNSPMNYRMRAIAKMLPKISALITLDKELFVWAALARWLAREQVFDLAVSVLSEYESLSLKLSQGGNQDALGILSDLLEKPWFESRRTFIQQRPIQETVLKKVS